MDIPEYFRQKAKRIFGEQGPGWVESLPFLLTESQRRWELKDCVFVDDLSINLICYAVSQKYGDVVLKIQGPHSERITELTALEIFDGRLACKCLEYDHELAAMLLERIVPGDMLRNLESKDEQLSIGTEIMRILPVPIDNAHGLPTYADWITKAFSVTRRDYNTSSSFKNQMKLAWELFCEVNDAETCLLHGDLHHDNILRFGQREWKTIDPQGVIASPVFECGRFIENHVISDDEGLNREETQKTISYVADGLNQPPRRVAAATFILHLLSMCWGYQMNYSKKAISQGERECDLLLEMIRNL